MSEILPLDGRPALSNFRLAKLQQGLTASRPSHRVAGITATFRHFVEIARPLAGSERATLDRLLTYGPETSPVAAAAVTSLLVVPRPGTLSPWSSKATDIAKNCGLDAVVRIERGIVYGISTSDGTASRQTTAAPCHSA
jgi:phosphoribosylformylglycinamidine synthase